MGPREWSPRFKPKIIPFDFPRMAALVDNNKAAGYEIEFVREMDVHQFTEIKAEYREEIAILNHRHECETSDALMVIRPWIRVGPLVSKVDFDTLRTSRYTLAFDGVGVVKEAVEKILIGKDGRWVWEHAYRMPMFRSYPFDATLLDNEKRALGAERFGNFLSNNTRIEMILHVEGRPRSSLFLYSGLVAALYSTRLRR